MTKCLKICVADFVGEKPKVQKPKPVWSIEVVEEIIERIVEFVSLARSPNLKAIKLFPSLKLRNVLMAL